MKKILTALLLAALAAGLSWADDIMVSVHNPEPYRFWFVLDLPEFADEAPESPTLVD
jgi:hypothetical protein